MRKGVQFSTAWPARQQSALNNRPISNEDVLILDLAIFGQIPPREYCHRRSSACLAVSSAGLDNRPPNHMWRRGHRDVTPTKRRKCIKYRIDHGWRRPDRTSLPQADRKSVVQGKSVSVRVDLGGRRIHTNKQQ